MPPLLDGGIRPVLPFDLVEVAFRVLGAREEVQVMRRREISIFGAAAVALTCLGFAPTGRAEESSPLCSWS